jgi:phage-related protein
MINLSSRCRSDQVVYEVIFYEDSKGHSSVLDFIVILNNRAFTNKNVRIMLKQVRYHINILERLGTWAGEPFVKHVQDKIWELRPGNNRILFFVWKDNKIVLLHYFRKKSNKTPQREIDIAMNRQKDWIERND